MLGIAVGTREIKVSLVDFAFQPVPRKRLRELGLGSLLDRDLLSARKEPKEAEEDYICLNSSQDLEKLAETLNNVLLAFLQTARASEDTSNPALPLVGIGIAFPGAVDTQKTNLRLPQYSMSEREKIWTACCVQMSAHCWRAWMSEWSFATMPKLAFCMRKNNYSMQLTLYVEALRNRRTFSASTTAPASA